MCTIYFILQPFTNWQGKKYKSTHITFPILITIWIPQNSKISLTLLQSVPLYLFCFTTILYISCIFSQLQCLHGNIFYADNFLIHEMQHKYIWLLCLREFLPIHLHSTHSFFLFHLYNIRFILFINIRKE